MPIIRPIAQLAFACLIPVSLAAGQGQTPPVPAAQAPAAQAPSATTVGSPSTTPATVVHANANLVLVDVVVTDQGNAVHGLDKEHFHVFEDGHEQTITSFDEHRAATVPASAAKPVALPPNTYSNFPAYPQATAVNVLLLDGLNTPMADQMYVRRQMLQYMGKIAPGTSMAIFTLSSRLRMIEGFTTNPAVLAKAVQNPKATAQPSVVLDPQADQAIDALVGDMAASGAPGEAVSNMQQFQADITAFQTDQRVQMTMDAMQELARYLSAIPGRKNLIWFSGSFPISLDPDLTLQNPFQATREYGDQVRETSELLAAARVAVYPVDARGLMGLPATAASYTPSTNLMPSTSGKRGAPTSAMINVPNPGKDNAKFLTQTMNEQASMKAIAEQTGGKEYINTNGLKEAVASAVENGGSYYTIGFVPPATQLDGPFHKIQLRADNGGWQLAYRRGYYADFSDKPSAHNPGKVSLMVAATLHGAPPATQIIFQARVLPANDPLLKDAKLPDGPAGELTAALKGPAQHYIVDIVADPRGLGFEVTPDGVHQAAIEFTLVAFNAEGQCVNYLDRSFLLKLKAEQYAQIKTTGIHIRLPLDLPPGPASLRIAVHDLAAGRAGSLEVPLTVAAR